MYSSLDRVDVVTTEPDGQGRYFQTDHREADEIEANPDLSVLFALVRVLNAKRMVEPGEPEPIVTYVSQNPPPEFLRQAVRAAGGECLIHGEDQTEQDEDEPPLLADVIASAFAGLARSVAEEFGVDLSIQGLETVEKALAETAGDPEENEVDYWTAVVKLGTFGGEVIRASNGGQWKVVETGTLPFALETKFRNGGSPKVNPLAKAIKRFANGDEDTLIFLVQMIQGDQP
jgi:hypothetical protein